MSFLEDVNFENVVEPTTVPAGEEYQIRIIDIKTNEAGELPANKNGNKYLLPLFEIPDEVGAKSFSQYLGLPSNEMSSKAANTTKYNLQQFLKCFGFDPSEPPDDPENLVGAEGYAILGEKNDPMYGDQNTIKRWLVER